MRPHGPRQSLSNWSRYAQSLTAKRASGFDQGIGPDIYDIHLPRAPSVAEITRLLDTALASIPARQLWVNPDCGLKTRGYAETLASLQNILAATRAVRERLAPSA